MDVYNFLVTHLGVSLLDALLLLLLWLVAKARYEDLIDAVRHQKRRLDRIERALSERGFIFTRMEDE